jgi:cobalt-zinc-cadmium efflux system protein
MQGHHTHHTNDPKKDHNHDPKDDHDHDHAHSHEGADAHAHTKAKPKHDTHAGHSHGPMNYDRAFAVGISLNLLYALSEAIAGVWLGSLALVADAGHNLSDVIGLLLAWGAVWLSRRAPTASHSYGLGRSSILAALGNAMLLLIAVGIIVWEAAHRFLTPTPIATTLVIAIATFGIAINGFTAWLFMRGGKADLNVRGAYLHMVADAAVSLGVVIAAVVMRYTGAWWLDPVVSIVIAAVIAWGTWGLLRDSLRLSLDGVPAHIDATAVAQFLAADANVSDVHDLHIWALSTEAVAMTAHVICPAGHPGDAWLAKTCDTLHEKFHIDHATIQVETGDRVHPKTGEQCGISLTS